jgi:mRNA interferase HigB
VRIIARRIIDDFEVALPDSTKSRVLFKISKGKKWFRTIDIKNDQANASIIANNRVVFNIKRNDFRLVVAVDYQRLIIFNKVLDTHAKYDKN